MFPILFRVYNIWNEGESRLNIDTAKAVFKVKTNIEYFYEAFGEKMPPNAVAAPRQQPALYSNTVNIRICVRVNKCRVSGVSPRNIFCHIYFIDVYKMSQRMTVICVSFSVFHICPLARKRQDKTLTVLYLQYYTFL
jgi:hypothetical protein